MRLALGLGLDSYRKHGGGILDLAGTSYWLAGTYGSTTQYLDQLGTSGAGDAQFGSTTGADSNDPTALDWTSAAGDYLYLPGTAGNSVTVANPVASADIVITYSDGSTDDSNTGDTADPLTFGGTDVLYAGLKIRSIQIKNNSGGAEVGLFEASESIQTGHTDGYSNVFTINRTASGLKSTLVTRPVFVLNSAASTYAIVADHADFQIGTAQDFTFWTYARLHHAMDNGDRVFNYRNTEGYMMLLNGTSLQHWLDFTTAEADDIITATGAPTLTASQLFAAGRGGSVQFISTTSEGMFEQACATDAVDSQGTALQIGIRNTGTGASDMEVFAFGVHKGTALNATQLTTLKTELDALLGGRSGE